VKNKDITAHKMSRYFQVDM